MAWGYSNYGGDSSAVAADLASGVTHIYTSITTCGFVAKKSDGSLVYWGDVGCGHTGTDPSASDLAGGADTIFFTSGAAAAKKADGSVFTWGDTYTEKGANSTSVNFECPTSTTASWTAATFDLIYFKYF